MSKKDNWPNHTQYVEHNQYVSSQYVCPQMDIPLPFGSTNNWAHVPPQTMPWGLPSNSHPPIVRFTAGDFPSQHAVKRKPEQGFEMRPAKQLVTEEKMAAHMSNLHISEVERSTISHEDEIMERQRLPKLYICDEIKNLKADPIIPESILNKIERPKMAVVLWKPPANDLENQLQKVKKSKEIEDAMIIENNNVDNTFRPIDPVPMPSMQKNEFFQPIPQFHSYFPYS